MKNKEYPLIPLSEITDEARKIAVAWGENMKDDFIDQKHKLASDIMNYARNYHEGQLESKNHITLDDDEIHDLCNIAGSENIVLKTEEAMQKKFALSLKETHNEEMIAFAEWLCDTPWIKVHSDTLNKSAYVDAGFNNILINGSDYHFTELIKNHGKTIEQMLAIYKQEQENKKD